MLAPSSRFVKRRETLANAINELKRLLVPRCGDHLCCCHTQCKCIKTSEGHRYCIAITSTLQAEGWHEDAPKVPSDHRVVISIDTFPQGGGPIIA